MNVTMYETLLNDVKAEALSVLKSALERHMTDRGLYELKERYVGMCDGIRKAYLMFTSGENEIEEAFRLCRIYRTKIINAYEIAIG